MKYFVFLLILLSGCSTYTIELKFNMGDCVKTKLDIAEPVDPVKTYKIWGLTMHFDQKSIWYWLRDNAPHTSYGVDLPEEDLVKVSCNK